MSELPPDPRVVAPAGIEPEPPTLADALRCCAALALGQTHLARMARHLLGTLVERGGHVHGAVEFEQACGRLERSAEHCGRVLGRAGRAELEELAYLDRETTRAIELAHDARAAAAHAIVSVRRLWLFSLLPYAVALAWAVVARLR